ncbi:phenylacetaldehyde reductase-like isoform X1 [Spinacia oleracea]|uniref:Phenylacetaldehyde reductase-like isoform X1 n=2 Tax=Spinacia oleracea TaxID=3562 RepID=A0ABM3QJ06_SPIOL|nr:phenylacetaldehyde reductase-like isoform X1 [Spinacia oleracea]
MDSKGGERKKVCVTGASGFIASWIVKLLLHRGYSVNGTVLRQTYNCMFVNYGVVHITYIIYYIYYIYVDDPNEVEQLVGLEGAKERLELFEANLMVEGSFDSAIHGCDGVFHSACPVKLQVCDPHAGLQMTTL